MSEKSQALRLINNLLADIREPDFIWQVVALLACIGSALLIARWWRSRHEEGSGRLNDASARLAFPLTGMVLTGIALTTLDNFLHTHLLKLAMPLLGSMALVRGVIFVLRQA
ncbi:MAG TPA: mechanosensitive ion channel protein MscS, partial [Azonexus sp.]|nr:mechanosensitive ion channel protein MscS [Azonexus sp.]